jgi:23S rRNA (cytosine1962-C5)-methyltransferase
MEQTYVRQAEMLANRVKKRFLHLRKRYARQNLEVFRLYDWDIPEIRAVVDWYAGHLVVGEYTRKQSSREWLPLMGTAVVRALDVPEDRLHLKIRRAGIEGGTRYKRIDHKNQKSPMAERDLKFLINPTDFVDTGLFSDHRNTRQMVRERVAGKTFLNLYCYTGAFTCYAAKGDAARTVSVDRSETAIQWARENLELNGLWGPAHELIQKDTLDFLSRPSPAYENFDLAVVDPPSFSTTRVHGIHFDIAKDHPGLLDKVFQRMAPGGTVFFSTNHQDFELDTRSLSVSRINEITEKTIPEDYASKRRQIQENFRVMIIMHRTADEISG